MFENFEDDLIGPMAPKVKKMTSVERNETSTTAGYKKTDPDESGPSKGFAGISQKDEKRLYTTFKSRKNLWLSEIAKHSAPITSRDEADKSVKGFIDQRCLPIIGLLNAHPDYVTTSSCSGRISLFHSVNGEEAVPEGEPQQELFEDDAAEDSSAKMKRGAEGSLGWILASHESPLTEDQIQLILRHTVPNAACETKMEACQESIDGTLTSSSSTKPMRSSSIPLKGQVSLKCEPFLLHVQCRTIEAAKKLLNAASDAGFRNSGMIPPGKNIMVGIRHASLSIDCPLVADGGISFATEPYVRYLVSVAEEKMAENFRRTLLLEKCIDNWINQK